MRYLTAGESHGQVLVGILEGIPAGLEIDEAYLAVQLHRRQQGYGRGGRMRIEKDRARILSGVRFGKTLGSPIALIIENLDWKNWQEKMSVAVPTFEAGIPKVEVPRPGHADLAGVLKYGFDDIRNVIERASARETAMRVALGSVARKLLEAFHITIASHVLQVHNVRSRFSLIDFGKTDAPFNVAPNELNARADASPVRCLDAEAEKQMMARIDEAKAKRDTVGGVFEVAAFNVPVGLGSYAHCDRRLDARLAAAMMSIPAIKGVEIGEGFAGARRWGSETHDPIYHSRERGYYRSSNNAGGVEAGITNGEPLVVRVAMKPLSTLMQPLDSVNIHTHEATPAHIERSDVCAVPAASVIGEAMMALVLAEAFLEKFGGDSMTEIHERLATNNSRRHLV
ncbi:MAG: chorismate synthase [candidate division KSB1 bacterium]|nr:chorismate synthase [candidate division KSB1 bacterium]